VKTLTFFNNKGGVGKTSLVYHLAYMFANLGFRILCADLDPQANLSSMFLDDDALESIYAGDVSGATIKACIRPILQGTGDIAEASIVEAPLNGSIGLIVGDIGLTDFEDRLSESWPRALDRDPAALRTTTAFARIIEQAALAWQADIVLVDVGPNLGAINRAALVASDEVVIPLAPDLFSLRGLRNLGPALVDWRKGWQKRLDENAPAEFKLPAGTMEPLGYVVLQHAIRLDRPEKAYGRWMKRIPATYREAVVKADPIALDDLRDDENCLATLKNYRSLMPLAQDARKPMFALRQADGALGAQQSAVASCYDDFKALALRIAQRSALSVGTRA
jgi:cellulose biosynthesis protein BcsQ